MRDDKPTFDVDRPMWDVVGSLPETEVCDGCKEKQEAIEELRKSLAGIVEWQRINRWEHNAAHNEAVRVLRMTAKFGNKDKEVRQFRCPCGREFGINDCVGIVMCPVCGNAGLDILVRFNLDRKGMDV